ncbi:MAG: hypothetical protein CMK59_13165 [Proteobacteria bacterium]|nr:hypothetical protein [Pseudomonadota bacterium]
MIAYVVLAGVILAITISTINRVRGAARIPPGFWISIVLVSAVPFYSGYAALTPGEATDRAALQKVDDVAVLKYPEGSALLVTGQLKKLSAKELKNPLNLKTDYALKITGVNRSPEGKPLPWNQSESGTIERMGDKEEDLDVDLYEGETLSTSGKQRNASGLREDLQARYLLKGNGDVRVALSNYHGGATEAILLEVIKAPPPTMYLWLFGLVFSAIGIYYEAWWKCEKVGQDFGFLSLYGVFLVDVVAPLDGYIGVLYSAMPTFLMGYGAVAGFAFLAVKYKESQDKVVE